MIPAHLLSTETVRFTCPTYRSQLHPWCIVQLLPDMQRLTVARLRRRGDAEAHLNALQRMNGEVAYCIVFDPRSSESLPMLE